MKDRRRAIVSISLWPVILLHRSPSILTAKLYWPSDPTIYQVLFMQSKNGTSWDLFLLCTILKPDSNNVVSCVVGLLLSSVVDFF